MTKARLGSRIAIVVCSLWAGGAIAQEEFNGRTLGACISDISEHCADVRRGGGRVIKCLQVKREALTADCKATVTPSDFIEATQGVAITVDVTNLRSKNGVVFVTLGDDPDEFPTGRRTVILPATGDSVVARFTRLRPNAYAVLVFHDENDNGRFDMFSEGSATSNDAHGMPDFNASAVKVTADTTLAVAMKYPE